MIEFNSNLGQQPDPVGQAIGKLRMAGYQIDRADFPGPPFPNLYIVSGPDMWGVELTEAQIVNFAQNK